MAERPGSPYRSANAGELSLEAGGRVDIKQFYSAGLRYKNVEPVPLSGFRQMAGSLDLGPVRKRIAVLAHSGAAATPGDHPAGPAVIWQAAVAGVVAAIDCAALDASAGLHSVQAQARVGLDWVNVGAPVAAGTAARAITMAAAPRQGVSATAVRLLAAMTATASITTGTVTVLTEGSALDAPRYEQMQNDDGSRYLLSLQAQWLDIYRDDAFVAAAYLPDVTLAVQPHVDFYAEDATIGIAERHLKTQRVRRGATSGEWVRDLWPFSGIPKVDLGGTYPKTDDKWEVQIKWTDAPFVYLTLTVNGESTTGVPFVDAANAPVPISGAVDNGLTAGNIQAALEALPSLGPGVSVAIVNLAGNTKRVDVIFGGGLSGVEYQLISEVTNSADAAALSSHVQIGKTEFEPLFSDERGWPGVFGFAQDRLAYGDIAAVPPALSFSQAGEYFTVNIEAAGASAARLDKLRAGQVSERVLGVTEATYLLVGTDRAVHFASNRTINKTDPLNFVETSDTGMVPNCRFQKLENKVYYVGVNPKSDPPSGSSVLSLGYSEIETAFDANPEHIFATHLVEKIVRFCGQVAGDVADNSKLWCMRSDGRLIAACIIKSQDVLGFVEWICAGGGAVREICVDAANDVRLTVERGGDMRHERMDRGLFLQAAIVRTPDLSGGVTGLELHEGREVWAVADGYVLGPFTVDGGRIDLGGAYAGQVTVGLWQPPLWESMPRHLITRTDEILRRPGRIHSARVQVIETDSIAIGANGQPAQDVPLTRASSPVDAPPPPFTGSARRFGMLGAVIGPTLVITQKRPGRMHVRDLDFQEKL